MNEANLYLKKLLPKQEEWTSQLEDYAHQNKIPIMDSLSMNFLIQLIHLQKPTKILEIGTAIGYSALRMHYEQPNMKITTIERNENMYKEAKRNFSLYKKNNNIQLILGNALSIMENELKDDPFEFILIDAAKLQYKRFFNLADNIIQLGGTIVADNVLFRNYVFDETKQIPNRLKKIAKSLNRFNQYITNHPQYYTTIVPIGDGLSISTKIKTNK